MIYHRAQRLTHRDLTADWTRRVRRLWSQDDAVPDEDTVDLAWRRLFGGCLPRKEAWIAVSDGGDHEVLVDDLGRVYVSSYPGANELGVLRQSPADASPRLVVSGGQTGADRGALEAALEVGWPIGGWAPRGWRAEDGQVPSPYRDHMQEMESGGYDERTRENVSGSDGTLVVSLLDKLATGSRMTWDYAGQVRRPRLHVVARWATQSGSPLRLLDEEADRVVAWLDEHQVGVLNVAGPRESRQPGACAAARGLVRRVLEIVAERQALTARLGWARVSSAADAVGTVAVAAAAEDSPPGARESAGTPGEPLAELPAAAPRRHSYPTLSSSQEDAVRAALRWISDPRAPQVFRLAGVAGSGKSTLVQEIVARSGRHWLYAASTGKAALVMEKKGLVGARTIHSLIYCPVGDPAVGEDGRVQLEFRVRDNSPLHDSFGVVVDEGSMVDRGVGEDLVAFGKRILVLYDPAQLPPVDGSGFFVQDDPDVMLHEVHRQARDSGILDLATFVREGGDLLRRVGWEREDCAVVSRDRCRAADLMKRMSEADQVIVGRNDTRHRMNRRYRELLRTGSELPVAGEKVICLRNERRLGLLNGSMWCVRSSTPAGPSTLDLGIDTLDGIFPGSLTPRVWHHHFLAREAELAEMGPVRFGFPEFDYGYFITVHKAQGSQWDDVVLYDESRIFRADRSKWLYTGITRAARRLLVVV